MYMQDSYLKEFDTTIKKIDGKFIVLEQSVFHPKGGGQPHDTGKIICGDQSYTVMFVGKFDGILSHEVDKEGLKEGDTVHCVIDWERRYKLMRMHTAAHLVSAIFIKNASAKITGNQLDVDKSRIDFNLENFDKEKIEKYVGEANQIASEGHEVKVYFMLREEALKNPQMVKLAGAMPPKVKELRVVEIDGVDVQADGGTHVHNTKEIGTITIIKMGNKGKNNRRLYFTL